MNQVDFLILVLLGVSLGYGVSRGLLVGLADLAALFVAVALGALLYRVGGFLLHFLVGAQVIADFLGFLLITMGAGAGTAWAVARLLAGRRLPQPLNRVGGGVCGLLLGWLLIAAVLIASGLLPQALPALKASSLAPGVVRLVPEGFAALERVGLAVPKLVRLPVSYEEELKGARQGLQFLQVNFSRLEGALCLNCRTPVHFLGYQFSRGTLMSPKFRCPNCGRTTDGCQLFEGFHEIYGKCPVELAEKGIMFDCGVWTNGWWVVPNGPCPVDGKEYPGPRPKPHRGDGLGPWS